MEGPAPQTRSSRTPDMLKSGLATMSLVAAKTTIPIDPNRPPHRPRPRKSGRFTLHAHRAHSRATTARHLARPRHHSQTQNVHHQVTGILTHRSILTNETLILDGEINLAVGPLEACYKSMICPFDDAEAYPASYMPSEAENSHKPILQFLFRHIQSIRVSSPPGQQRAISHPAQGKRGSAGPFCAGADRSVGEGWEGRGGSREVYEGRVPSVESVHVGIYHVFGR